MIEIKDTEDSMIIDLTINFPENMTPLKNRRRRTAMNQITPRKRMKPRKRMTPCKRIKLRIRMTPM